ncbi:Uncharacterised protein [Mycobacterium tuberculosis]|uniref:Uncharacterized protein n=1 Tax=Mycobacterium tuberculosis TaxID=1773 RepID=A0A654U3Z1_MYCTX|nr:Uncharacterised protein [Mycobacterium tuberculosis]
MILPALSTAMSCSMTRATRMSSTLSRARWTASAAACSQDVGLVPMMSITLYTLMGPRSRSRPTSSPDVGAEGDARWPILPDGSTMMRR